MDSCLQFFRLKFRARYITIETTFFCIYLICRSSFHMRWMIWIRVMDVSTIRHLKRIRPKQSIKWVHLYKDTPENFFVSFRYPVIQLTVSPTRLPAISEGLVVRKVSLYLLYFALFLGMRSAPTIPVIIHTLPVFQSPLNNHSVRYVFTITATNLLSLLNKLTV